jgi:hypothetical protein
MEPYENDWHDSIEAYQARCTWTEDSQGFVAASTISAVIAVMHR